MLECFSQVERGVDLSSNNTSLELEPPFEVMYDAGDYAIGAVLGQRKDNKPYTIYYAS